MRTMPIRPFNDAHTVTKDPTKDDRQGLARERPEPSTADVAADKDEAGAE